MKPKKFRNSAGKPSETAETVAACCSTRHRHWRRMGDTTKRLVSSPKCRSVEVINNPARPGSNHREVNCINYR